MTDTEQRETTISKEVDLENKAKVLVKGVFRPGDIEVTMSGQVYQPPPELLKKIDQTWEPNARRGFFPGPLVRMDDYDLTPEGKLQITLGRTNYKDFLGTRDRETRA